MDDIDYCKIAVLTLLAVCAVFLPASSYFTKSHVTYFAAADQLVQHQVATLGSAQTVGQDPVARPVWHAIHRNQMPTPHRSTDSSTGPHEGVGLAPASAALLVTGDASVDGAYTNVCHECGQCSCGEGPELFDKLGTRSGCLLCRM